MTSLGGDTEVVRVDEESESCQAYTSVGHSFVSLSVKDKLPEPTPGGKWSQYSKSVHHGKTKECADIAIRDYRNWARRQKITDFTHQSSIIAYKDWLLED